MHQQLTIRIFQRVKSKVYFYKLDGLHGFLVWQNLAISPHHKIKCSISFTHLEPLSIVVYMIMTNRYGYMQMMPRINFSINQISYKSSIMGLHLYRHSIVLCFRKEAMKLCGI